MKDYLLSGEQYLEKILVALDFYDDISNVKVILPTVASCEKLQHMIITSTPKRACFLPQIVPIVNVGIGSEGIYSIPKEAIEPISLLEQKILIAQLIMREKSDTTISQALLLANHIIRLFDELQNYQIELKDLALEIPINEAQHWQYMLEFLLKIHANWSDLQVDFQKIDMAEYRISMLEREIDAIKKGKKVIIAGIIPRGKLIIELLKAAYESPQSLLILPNFENSSLEEEVPVTHKKWIYNLYAEFMESCDFQGVREGDKDSQVATDKNFNCKHIVTPTLLLEACRIRDKAKEWVNNGVQKIAIVTQNSELINMVENTLDMETIPHINIGGYMLSYTKQYEFFLMLIKALDSEYILNLENTIILFKSPYLYCEEIVNFEYNIRKEHISSDEELEKWIKKSEDLLQVVKILVEENKNIKLKGIKDIASLLRIHISLAEKLAPYLWNGDVGKVFAELLYDLLSLVEKESLQINFLGISKEISNTGLKDYLEFLEQTMIGARYFKNLSNQQIYFMNLEEACIGGYEYIICADMNEGSMPRSVPYDPWMNTQMRVSIGLPDVAENIGIDWYYFSKLLGRKDIFLTRSLKVGSKEAVASRFWREIIADANNTDEIVPLDSPKSEAYAVSTLSKDIYNYQHLFPEKISATNIELLIRNPYGFFAKYILKLRKLENIFEENKLAKFGDLLHKILETYTNEYKENIPDKYAFILEIGYKISDSYSKEKINLWWPKLTAVMKAFIDFDEKRRMDGRKVFSEIYGEMPIFIGDKKITITAIADRVEQDSAGNIYILDYKTGTLPTKQDIMSGISVQMIVEALIVQDNGFKEVRGRACEMTYIKISSRHPYIDIVTYKTEEFDLAAHKEGLYKILSYAIKGEFPINENSNFAPKYNDYQHLSRVGV